MRLRAFIHGITEYRLGVTTHYAEPFICWYDKGRSLAIHLLGGSR